MPKPPFTPKSEREARLAQALRANLRRRKTQARERALPRQDEQAEAAAPAPSAGEPPAERSESS
jgi:hypothetical protein